MLMISGANGWEHKKWKGTYYPNEIATDWHLSFYAKEFQTVLAPFSFWSNCSLDEIKEFCSDVNEEYPILFELNDKEENEITLELQNSIKTFIPNSITFKKDGWQYKTDNYQITQAEIISSKNLEKDSAVFNVYSDELLNNAFIEEIMKVIKQEFKSVKVAYVYFDGELASADLLNTVKTLRRMLALD